MFRQRSGGTGNHHMHPATAPDKVVRRSMQCRMIIHIRHIDLMFFRMRQTVF
jgi:hypothetical protein